MENTENSDRLTNFTTSEDYFDPEIISLVLEKARKNDRGRFNFRIHENDDSRQHLFINAIVANSYVRPHMHNEINKTEMFRILEGEAYIVFFNDAGDITNKIKLSSKVDGRKTARIRSGQIHTVVCEEDVVLLESKKQPSGYRKDDDKSFVLWAPKENTEEGRVYFQRLLTQIK